ncbi:hypothetical protein RZS08_44520, partial [Arthrospira platensis SPKY1]|nr:hypothetical protein [Arthrospira platensis SPKY1]
MTQAIIATETAAKLIRVSSIRPAGLACGETPQAPGGDGRAWAATPARAWARAARRPSAQPVARVT